MNDSASQEENPATPDSGIQGRRLFLHGMGKWSGAAIGAAVAGAWLGGAPHAQAAGWVNRRVGGGGWINGGGGGWVNRRAGGGGWINRH
jgi:hypothetical protein